MYTHDQISYHCHIRDLNLMACIATYATGYSPGNSRIPNMDTYRRQCLECAQEHEKARTEAINKRPTARAIPRTVKDMSLQWLRACIKTPRDYFYGQMVRFPDNAEDLLLLDLDHWNFK